MSVPNLQSESKERKLKKQQENIRFFALDEKGAKIADGAKDFVTEN